MTRLSSPDPSLDDLLTRARLAHESIFGKRVDSAAALERAMEAGDALIAVKAKLRAMDPPGKWNPALASIGIKASTARLYMQLTRARDRIVAAGCRSIREARRLLAGTKPRRPRSTSSRRDRPVEDRYQEGYADGYRAGRADGYTAGQAAGQAQPRPGRNGHVPVSLDPKDMRWLITLAHPDKHEAGNLRATRVTQWLNELLAHARQAAAS